MHAPYRFPCVPHVAAVFINNVPSEYPCVPHLQTSGQALMANATALGELAGVQVGQGGGCWEWGMQGSDAIKWRQCQLRL